MKAPRWLRRLWCLARHRLHYGVMPDGWHWICQVDSFVWEFSVEDVLRVIGPQLDGR